MNLVTHPKTPAKIGYCLQHTANVLTVEYADVCLRSESKDNHELYLQSFVCGVVVLASTRKYPLRGYILGPPGWPESIFSAGLGLTFFSYSHFGKVSTQLLGSRQGSACVDHPTVKIEYT